MNHDIYQVVRDRIIFLEYAPGQILKEQVLATEFGVSRTPLRTVLSRLEWEHLVRILPRTGIQVAELELNTMTHVFQARLELECVIGTRAAERFTRSHLTRLETLTDRCDRLRDHRESRALGQLDMDLKQLFHEAAANPFLTETSRLLYALTFRLWYFNLTRMDNEAWEREAWSLHADLLALSDLLAGGGTPEQVGRARKAHLLEHVERIRNTFLGLSGS